MRASGILLPVSSLPGKYGIGCFSKEAYDFVDVLEKANQKYWQILPIGPTSYGDSPYQSFSTFAGNPYFISLEKLIEEELLTEEECNSVDFGENNEYIDYEKLYNGRFNLLKKAYKRSNPEDEGFKKFVEENGFWIEDYAMFMTIKAEHNGESFELWEDEIRVRKPEAMERYREKFKDEILFYKFIQFKFYEQWFKLKEYANDKGIKLLEIFQFMLLMIVRMYGQILNYSKWMKRLSLYLLQVAHRMLFLQMDSFGEILFTSGIIISRQVIHGGLRELKIAQSFMM